MFLPNLQIEDYFVIRHWVDSGRVHPLWYTLNNGKQYYSQIEFRNAVIGEVERAMETPEFFQQVSQQSFSVLPIIIILNLFIVLFLFSCRC